MKSTNNEWRPNWWTEDVHGSAWERVKAAMQRDWTQTKHDLHLGGHEMNQEVADTVKQAAGKQPLPPMDQANPPKVIGEWSEAEVPYAYGYGARRQFGAEHPQWNEGLEQRLESEWRSEVNKDRPDWGHVAGLVRRGYEYDDRQTAASAAIPTQEPKNKKREARAT